MYIDQSFIKTVPCNVCSLFMQGMTGFIKGLTAADIPGTNNFVPFTGSTAEPVSLSVLMYC